LKQTNLHISALAAFVLQVPAMPQTALENINLLILDGRLDEASRMLAELKPGSLAEQRRKANYEGVIIFHRGRILEAKTLLEKAIQDFGGNVNLLCDLIVCQYHAQDMIGFRQGLSQLELALLENEAKLETRSLFFGELTLGKFLEEDARLAPAILFYERALARAEQPAHRFRALIQKARWQALYEPSHELSGLYRELISIPSENLTHDLRVELQHSLMLIELRLIGADHAWQRVERLSEGVANIDRRLLVFDFVEGALAQDLELSAAVLKIINEFDNLDPYEEFLRRLVKEPLEAATKIDELATLSTKLSWSSFLRLLCLTANMETQATAKQELNRKIQLIIRSLDGRSQTLWNQRLKQALQTPEVRVELSLRARRITVQGKAVDLSKKKIALQLLSGLAEKEALSVDEAIRLLWQSTFSPEHYHRLRMSTHRLNSLIHDITGLGKVIEVDSQTVRLRPEVRLKRNDDNFEVAFPNL
jgi:hypothetical protein